MGPTSAVDVAMSTETSTSTATEVRVWLSPRLVVVCLPRDRTLSLRDRMSSQTEAMSTSGSATG